ncbi:MAG TPA: hypothetical protein VFA07_11690 [Chthonomonadaceae bacterium]|nr:hypothetical protein [Chthonomonadaceae bacterium]
MFLAALDLEQEAKEQARTILGQLSSPVAGEREAAVQALQNGPAILYSMDALQEQPQQMASWQKRWAWTFRSISIAISTILFLVY